MRHDRKLTLGLLAQLERFQHELKHFEEVTGSTGAVHQAISEVCNEALRDEPWGSEALKRFIVVIQAGYDLLETIGTEHEREPLEPSPLESSADAAGEWDIDARMAEREKP